MPEMPPRTRREPRPAPPEPPVGTVGTPTSQSEQTEKPYPIPHDLEWSTPKTTRMTRDHENLLNELKFHHGLKIQEAVWYALENTYRNP